MFEQARRDGHSKIGLCMLPPSMREPPNMFGLGLDELTDANDRLPTPISFAVRRRFAGKHSLRAGNHSLNGEFG